MRLLLLQANQQVMMPGDNTLIDRLTILCSDVVYDLWSNCQMVKGSFCKLRGNYLNQRDNNLSLELIVQLLPRLHGSMHDVAARYRFLFYRRTPNAEYVLILTLYRLTVSLVTAFNRAILYFLTLHSCSAVLAMSKVRAPTCNK